MWLPAHIIAAAPTHACHIEQPKPFNGEVVLCGNWGEKQAKGTMFEFAFHFSLKYVYCILLQVYGM